MEIGDLQKMILDSEEKLSEELKEIWDSIKITPERWNEKTHGEFWVVAVHNNEVIWYNHIEEGFNMSEFNIEGEIGEYWAEQTDLHDLLWHLY